MSVEVRERATSLLRALLDEATTTNTDDDAVRVISAAFASERALQREEDATALDEAAKLRRKTATEKDYDPDYTIAIRMAHELEFIAAAIRKGEGR